MTNTMATGEMTNGGMEKEALIALSLAIASIRDKEDLDRVISHQLKRFFRFNDMVILVVNPDSRTQRLYSRHFEKVRKINDEYARVLALGSCVVEDGIIDLLLSARHPRVWSVSEVLKWEKTPAYISFWAENNMQKMAGLPVCNKDEGIGAILFYSQDEHAFSAPELARLSAISELLSIAVLYILAQEEIRKREMDRESSAFGGDQLRLLKVEQEKQQLEDEKRYLQEEIQTSHNYSEIIGTSNEMRKVFQLVSQVSATESSVLILGETGTGKELIARAIHNTSPRKDRLMVKVNCATLPANLIESELFGHERGSFTGATERRIGKFELANNSTLFLDEVGELPLDLQVKLLRALQEKEIERVGGRSVIKTDVRIIAATNRNLQREVHEGRFRSDLYFRLNVFPIPLPALRERKEDIPMLAAHFLLKHSKQCKKGVMHISSRAMKELTAYNWPGNVRELEHLIERSILLAYGTTIRKFHLSTPQKEDMDALAPGVYIKTINEVEREHIISVLKMCHGKVAGIGGAAEALRIPSTTLNSKIRRLKIKKGIRED